MPIREILDEASLELWLAGCSPEQIKIIVIRAAARVFPLEIQVIHGSRFKSKPSVLPIFRIFLALHVAEKLASKDLLDAVDDAIYAADSEIVYVGKVSGFAIANTATEAVKAIVATVAKAAEFTNSQAGIKAIWNNINVDATLIENEKSLTYVSLWEGKPPRWFDIADIKAKEILNKEVGIWDFWLQWWNALVAGGPFDWKFEKEVTLIPNAAWRRGPAEIAGIIKGIEQEIHEQNANNFNRLEPLKPKSIKHLLDAKTPAIIQFQGLASQITQVVERFLQDTGFNDLPEEYQALKLIPAILYAVSEKLSNASSTEDGLRLEIYRLNLVIAKLESDLRAAEVKGFGGLVSKNFAEQAGKSLGDWKMWGALFGAVSYINGMPVSSDWISSIADSVMGIFGKDQTMPHALLNISSSRDV